MATCEVCGNPDIEVELPDVLADIGKFLALDSGVSKAGTWVKSGTVNIDVQATVLAGAVGECVAAWYSAPAPAGTWEERIASLEAALAGVFARIRDAHHTSRAPA